MRILAFTTCKPWKDMYGRIQANAIRSWSLWEEPPSVVIFGDDRGSAEAAQQFGAIHRPHVELGDSGFPKIKDMFRQAELLARIRKIDMLMFANADMVITGLARAAAVVKKQLDEFLLISYRRDVKEVDLDKPGWLEELYEKSTLGPPDAIDLFCFTRGLWKEIPDFVSGHVGFDNWLVMSVRDRGLPIIDGTQVIGAFHQNHAARLLHRPDDRTNLTILAKHEGGCGGNWASRGRLTDANWLLVRDDLGGVF